jgi:hypothetical protein
VQLSRLAGPGAGYSDKCPELPPWHLITDTSHPHGLRFSARKSKYFRLPSKHFHIDRNPGQMLFLHKLPGRNPKFHLPASPKQTWLHSVQEPAYENGGNKGKLGKDRSKQLHIVQTKFTGLAWQGLRFTSFGLGFEAFSRKDNRVLTLSRQVLCHTKLEMVARIGSNSVLRGILSDRERFIRCFSNTCLWKMGRRIV